MQSKVRILGHPVHPMLTSFPIAFFTATLLCSIVYISTNNVFWFRVEFIANCAGLVMAILAVLPGLIDWLVIPMAREAKVTGMKHMLANGISVGLFGVNAGVSFNYFSSPKPPNQYGVLLSTFGFLIMLYAGFMGWKMVQTHHIGVDNSSNLAVEETEDTKQGANIFTKLREQEH